MPQKLDLQSYDNLTPQLDLQPYSQYRPVEEQPGFWGGIVDLPGELYETVEKTGKTAYKKLSEGDYPGMFKTLVDPIWGPFEGLMGMGANKLEGKPIQEPMSSGQAKTEGLSQIAGVVGLPTERFKEAYETGNYPRLAGQTVGAVATLGALKGGEHALSKYKVRIEREPAPVDTSRVTQQPNLPLDIQPYQEPLIKHPINRYDELADLGVRTPEQTTELDALREQLGVNQRPPYRPGVDPYTGRFRKIREEPTQQDLTLTPSEGAQGQMEMFDMGEPSPSFTTKGSATTPPLTGPGELPRVVTLKDATAADLAMYRNQGYVSVPGLRSPEGYVQMVRGDIAGLYTKAEKPGAITTPTPKETVRGAFGEGEAPANKTVTVPNAKVTPTFISNMEKGGYKVAGKDAKSTIFKFLGSEEGSFDGRKIIEWIDKIDAKMRRMLGLEAYPLEDPMDARAQLRAEGDRAMWAAHKEWEERGKTLTDPDEVRAWMQEGIDSVTQDVRRTTSELQSELNRQAWKFKAKDFYHDEEGSFDPQIIIDKLRELLGREPTEQEVQQEAFKGGYGARPGESTGNVAPFEHPIDAVAAETDQSRVRSNYQQYNNALIEARRRGNSDEIERIGALRDEALNRYREVIGDNPEGAGPHNLFSGEFQPLMGYNFPEATHPLGETSVGDVIRQVQRTGNPEFDSMIARMKQIVELPEMNNNLWQEFRELGHEATRHPSAPPEFRRDFVQASSEPGTTTLGFDQNDPNAFPNQIPYTSEEISDMEARSREPNMVDLEQHVTYSPEAQRVQGMGPHQAAQKYNEVFDDLKYNLDIPLEDLKLALEINKLFQEHPDRAEQFLGHAVNYLEKDAIKLSDKIRVGEERARFPGMSDALRYSPEMSARRNRQLDPTQQNLPMPLPVDTPELQQQTRLESVGNVTPEDRQLPLDFNQPPAALGRPGVNPARQVFGAAREIADPLLQRHAQETVAGQMEPEQQYFGGHEFQPDITQTNQPVPETGGTSPEFTRPEPTGDTELKSWTQRLLDFVRDDQGHFDWEEFRRQWAEMFPEEPAPFSRSNLDPDYQRSAGLAQELGIDPTKFKTLEELKEAVVTASEARAAKTGKALPTQLSDRRNVLSESGYDPFTPTEDELPYISRQRQELKALTMLEKEILARGDKVPLRINKMANDIFDKLVEYDNTSLAMPEPHTVPESAWERFLKGEEGTIDTDKLSWENIKEKTGWGMGRAAKMMEREINYIREALALPSAATTTGDFSAPGRQGLSMILTPQFWRAAGKMFQGLTPEGFRMIDEDLQNQPIMRKKINLETGEVGKSIAQEIGLKTFRPASEAPMGKRAEAVASRWLETGGSIPYFSKAYSKTIGVPVRATNRAYITFLNHLNVNRTQFLMDRARGMAVQAIETGEARPGFFKQKFSPEQAMDLNPYHNLVLGKEIADFVNTATGHAPLRTHILPYKGAELNLEKAAGLLNGTLFSPGLLASRVRMMNPNTYIMASPFVRKQYMKAALSTAAAWYAFTEMSKLYGEATHTDVEVSNDITSADFGKVRIGDTRMDPGGGFLQFLVAYGRVYKGGWTSSSSGEFHRFGSGYQAQTQEDAAERFLVNKLNPVAKFAWDIGSASEYNPFHVGDRTMQLFVPLVVQDMVEIAQEDPDLLPWMAPVSLGMGTQTYSKGESVGKLIDPENDWLVTGGGIADLMPWNQNQ